MRRRRFAGLVAGAAVGRPLLAHAQRPLPVIGFLHSGTQEQNANRLVGFRKGLAEAGLVEGRSVTIEYRWANGQNERLAAFAADLVARKAAVIVTLSSQPATMAAKAATASIPIVFTWPGDPVEAGLVASLRRPGGNATGIGTLNKELWDKRLGLLRQLAPNAQPVHLLINPTDPIAEEHLPAFQAAARTMGVTLQVMRAGSEREIDAAFAVLAAKDTGALLVNADPFLFIRRAQIAALAVRHGMPAVYYDREFAVSGGLMSYGTSLPRIWQQAAGYVARILKGEKPAELPVAQPTQFELVINLKVARALGLAVPSTLLFAADEVIE